MSFARSFLAIDRIQALGRAFSTESNISAKPELNSVTVFAAVLLSCLPAFFGFIGQPNSGVDVITIIVGVTAVLAILFRIRSGLEFHSTTRWFTSLSLTHTAFALGAIPAVILFILYPNSLLQVGQNQSVSSSSSGPLAQAGWYQISSFVLGVALWAGLTEEIIYRSLLVSVLRRWSGNLPQRQKDILAIVVSAGIFAASHITTWGFLLSFGLFGLGIGLGVAYIAIGERLLPLVLYHAAFDFLSLAFSVWLRSR